MFKYISILALLFSFNVSAEYSTISEKEVRENGRSVVEEVFFYGCIHCKNIDPEVREFKKKYKNLKVKQIPVVMSPKQATAAKHFYTAQYLNIEEKFSKLYFRALYNRKEIKDSLAKEILIKLGEKTEKIEEALNSHWVKEKVKSAKERTLKYKISTVPTFIVNEKYVLKRSSYKNDKDLFREILNLSK